MEASARPSAEEPSGKSRRRRRLPRVPTSLLVTLLVAALSVWIAPAITRQWDDRQKARVLQADLSDQVAVATAQTGRDLLALLDSADRPDSTWRFQERFLLTRIRIEARLETYFPPRSTVRRDWAVFVAVVDDMTSIAGVAGDGYGPDQGRAILEGASERHWSHLKRASASWTSASWVAGSGCSGLCAGFDLRVLREIPWKKPVLRGWARYGILQNTLFFSKLVDADIEANHPRGFSTTRGDLLRDLLP